MPTTVKRVQIGVVIGGIVVFLLAAAIILQPTEKQKQLQVLEKRLADAQVTLDACEASGTHIQACTAPNGLPIEEEITQIGLEIDRLHN